MKLMGFFRGKYGSKMRRYPKLDTSKARSLLPCLQNDVEIDSELVRKFLVH